MKMVLTLALGLAIATPAASEPSGVQRYDDRRGVRHDVRSGNDGGAPRRDGRRSDQQEAFDARRAGRILPLHEIEKRVVPGETARGGRYIGFDFQSPPGVYTLKFLRDGTVIWIEVDGRTGQVLGRTDQ